MSQIYDGDKVIPVTILEAGPCWVTQLKVEQKDGFNAWQIGFKTKKHFTKSQEGHIKKIGNAETPVNLKYIKEFRTDNSELKLGDRITVEQFQAGDDVKLFGISKGRGFTGVVKRHGFSGGPKSHGQKHQHRAPGSIGRSYPERVVKGMRMAGRSGSQQKTINTQVVKIDLENNLLLVKGAVPGRRGTLISLTAK